MSTLYFHIPFCKQACHYCDFHFSTVYKTYDAVVSAMMNEMESQRNFLPEKKLSSIYFGGGTPSLLNEKDLNNFIAKAHSIFQVADDAEITLEANPDDLTKEKLFKIKAAGVNRLSIGIQSFHDNELQLMNRSHNAKEAEDCIVLAQEIGFKNITIDLIFGLPGSNLDKWSANLNRAIDFGVPHLSAYSLTLEPKTALYKLVDTSAITLPSEGDVLEQYHLLCHRTRETGFEHYELSNYAKPGFESRHNTSYWKGDSYLGIGPSAHSFASKRRQWNIANNTRYVKAIQENTVWFEREEIDKKESYNEFVMTGLRTANGISLTQIDEKFQRSEKLLQDAQAKLECGKLQLNGDLLTIPESEWMMSDTIISDLFWI